MKDTLSGFLVIDKPEGITSFDVVARVRRAALSIIGKPAFGEKKCQLTDR